MGAVVFIGFMGSGKTTAARIFAERSGTSAVDVDQVIERQTGQSISELFETHGETGFRKLEATVTTQLLAQAQPGTPIALGGGAVENAEIREQLHQHTVVLREVSLEEAWARASRKPHRPLAANCEEFATRYTKRASLYEDLADIILPQGEKTLVDDAYDAIHTFCMRAPAGTKMLWATSSSGSYPVFIGRDILGQLWPSNRETKQRFCVADQQVANLYLNRFEQTLFGQYQIPGGESSKTLATAQRVWEELLKQNADRQTDLIALGGGVVGDLAGFCAATYQRGIAVVHLPTTVVAQVDSAYGGKTGIDLPHGKNYVGAYHQPAGVVADLQTLETLPESERAAGFAEVVKTALIAGGALWQQVASEGIKTVNHQNVIFGCARQKLQIVAADERDSGVRQRLNLGHTVGHAIEAATGFRRYRHGEAVGLGLLAALSLSGQTELRSQVCDLLRHANLPVNAVGLEVDQIIAEVQHDKKRIGDTVPFVLVDGPGSVRHGFEVEENDLRLAIQGVCE